MQDSTDPRDPPSGPRVMPKTAARTDARAASEASGAASGPLRIVLKLGGSVVLDPAQVAASAAEVQALKAAGHSVVVVHGGGPQLDTALAELGEAIQKVDGLRVTSRAASEVVRNVMESIGDALTAQWSAAGLASVHIGVAWEAFPSTPKHERLGRVGTVEAFVPPEPWPPGLAIITPVGFDAEGVLNINADEGARAVAACLRADWLVLGTDVAAVRGTTGEPMQRLTPAQAEELLAQRTATGGMVPKLGNALAALQAGVRNVLVTRIQPGFAAALMAGAPEGTLVAAAPVPRTTR